MLSQNLFIHFIYALPYSQKKGHKAAWEFYAKVSYANFTQKLKIVCKIKQYITFYGTTLKVLNALSIFSQMTF